MNDFKQLVRCTFAGSNQYGGEWVTYRYGHRKCYRSTSLRADVSSHFLCRNAVPNRVPGDKFNELHVQLNLMLF